MWGRLLLHEVGIGFYEGTQWCACVYLGTTSCSLAPPKQSIGTSSGRNKRDVAVDLQDVSLKVSTLTAKRPSCFVNFGLGTKANRLRASAVEGRHATEIPKQGLHTDEQWRDALGLWIEGGSPDTHNSALLEDN